MDPISIALGLAQFAPSILRFFGVGEKPVAVAEKVVEIAQSVTGAKTPEEAMQAMRENAQMAQQFNLAVLAADTELEKAFLADRQDARSRDVEVRKLTGGENKRADAMVLMAAVGTIGGFVAMAVLGYLKAKYPEALNDGVFGALLAQLSTVTAYFGLCLRDAFQFEFGSSRGSRDKDQLLAQGKQAA